MSVIAEFKRRSPSAGDIRAGATVDEIVGDYEARALRRCRSSPRAQLRRVAGRPARGARGERPRRSCARTSSSTATRSYESAVAGADALLLIVAALEDEALAELHAAALELELDVLVEVHDDEELERALQAVDAGPDRDQQPRPRRLLSVDVERTYELLADVPAGKTVVSESGIHSRDQLLELERVGVDAVLVGESLMRAPDPAAALLALTDGETPRVALSRPFTEPSTTAPILPDRMQSSRSPWPVAIFSALLGGAVAVGLALLLGLGGGDTTTVIRQAPLAATGAKGDDGDALTARAIYVRDAPGVVYVQSQITRTATTPLGGVTPESGEATGSGFVIDTDGTILTNAHVVDNATKVTVQFQNDKQVEAKILGRDRSTDLAVLKVDPKGLGLKPLKLGSSTDVEVGDPVVAIGNPFGLDRTLTTGVVSA